MEHIFKSINFYLCLSDFSYKNNPSRPRHAGECFSYAVKTRRDDMID